MPYWPIIFLEKKFCYKVNSLLKITNNYKPHTLLIFTTTQYILSCKYNNKSPSLLFKVLEKVIID